MSAEDVAKDIALEAGKAAALAALGRMSPDVQRLLFQTIENVAKHETPFSAAEQAFICTASRRLSIGAIKAALKLKGKMR